MSISRRSILLSAVCVGFIRPAFADSPDRGPPEGRRVALSGYDPVSYFEDGVPTKGSHEFWYGFDDVIYLFRSAEHRAKFTADPEHYAPQFDGYCAAGLSKGYKAEPDPEAWLIANGKLFVFQFKDRVPNFKKTIEDVAAKANANWPALKRQ
jgi:hypothetical protein